MKQILDDIVEKLPEEMSMVEIMAKVPLEERTPYVVVAFQECDRMNMLTSELRRSLKDLDLGLKVRLIHRKCQELAVCFPHKLLSHRKWYEKAF